MCVESFGRDSRQYPYHNTDQCSGSAYLYSALSVCPVCLFVCPVSVCLTCVCLSVLCLSVCLSCLSVCLFQYQKFRKRQQRQEKVQAKEAEREAEKKAVCYTIRMQELLNCFGEEDRENFRTGSNGAVVSGCGVWVWWGCVKIFKVRL